MMRRCLNEALCVARNRIAFGRALIEMPLMRRQRSVAARVPPHAA
jgi:alkylation response protein AidB-like acyl-CoA dehydrogenase